MAHTKKTRLALWVSPHDWKRYDGKDGSVSYQVSILRIDESDHKPRNCSRSSCYHEPQLMMFDDMKLACHVSWFNGSPFSTGFYGPRWDGYMILDSESDINAIANGWK